MISNAVNLLVGRKNDEDFLWKIAKNDCCCDCNSGIDLFLLQVDNGDWIYISGPRNAWTRIL